ncbi:MAG TPA: BatD family protein, partial [Ginsengibacter sp.]|nr:BatD family protein [Ginsengibacter sp.]
MIIHLHKNTARFLFLFISVIALSLHDTLFAQANFTAECPQKKIGKNDYLQVEFKVDHASNVQSINPPSFKNFSIVSGPNQESGMTSINGKVDQYVSISFILKPNSPGTYTIGPASAKADGKDFQSNSLNIEVTNSSATSSSAPNNAANLLSGFGGKSPFANLNLDFPEQPQTHQYDDYILKKGENVTDKVKKNLFIKLDVSKTNCYVGEPIV